MNIYENIVAQREQRFREFKSTPEGDLRYSFNVELRLNKGSESGPKADEYVCRMKSECGLWAMPISFTPDSSIENFQDLKRLIHKIELFQMESLQKVKKAIEKRRKEKEEVEEIKEAVDHFANEFRSQNIV